MTQLDDAYANAAYIPGAEAFPPKWTAAAEAFRAAAAGKLDVPYGPSPRQRFDFFTTDQTPKGTLIFVHGGYWRAFDNKLWSHFAAGALANGWSVAMPAYDLCPQVSIAMITQQIAAAVHYIAQETTGPITLAGHSAGGHLVARMLAPGMLLGQITDRLAHVMPISPLSDLTPLIQTEMNTLFGLDTAMAEAESPLLQPKPNVPVTVWVGANERPAFLDQAMWLASSWGSDEVIAPDKHHFDVIDDLIDPDSDMLRRLLPKL